MLSEKQAKKLLRMLIPFFVGIISMCVLSVKVPQTKFMESTVASLEQSRETVMEFAGVTVAASLAITALPDDFATPLAENLMDMNKYFVMILVAILLENLIVVTGTKIAFIYLIPIACVLYIISSLIKKPFIEQLAYKIAIFSVALIMVIPCSVHFTNKVASDYLAYVDETIDETGAGANKINDIMAAAEGSDTIFEKLSNAFHTAMDGITDLLEYFNNIIKRCVNSIAILFVTTFLMPIVTFLFFKWLIQQLLKTNLFKVKEIEKRISRDPVKTSLTNR